MNAVQVTRANISTGTRVRFSGYGWAVRKWMVGHEAEVIRPCTRGGLVEVRLNDRDAYQYGAPYISVHADCLQLVRVVEVAR